MGMYTGLRFKGIIKEEFREDIKTMLEEGEWDNCESQVLRDYSQVSRSSFIPFGSLSYMPDCWEEETGMKNEYGWDITKDTDGFNRYFNEETGLLCFQCSLKNYDDTIEYFLEKVIPVICIKTIHIEYLYEESTISTMYELKDGELKQIDKGIYYSENDYYDNEISEDTCIDYNNFDFTKENEYRLNK